MTIKRIKDTRPFADRILWGLGYKEDEALALSEGKARCVEDCGQLMQNHTFGIATDVTGTFLQNNSDINCLNTWSDHYRASKIPFLIVRESTTVLGLYKQREIFQAGQTAWKRKKERLKPDVLEMVYFKILPQM